MSTRLFVAGLPWETKDDELASHFSQAGQVVSAKVITDRNTGRSKGFGFVEMSNEADAEKAVNELNGSTIGTRQIVVKEAYPMKDRNDNGGNFNNNRG